MTSAATTWRLLWVLLFLWTAGDWIASGFKPARTELRDWTPAEIELLIKAVGQKYGGVCT